MAKRAGQNAGIRYSEGFKMAVVRELEEQDLPFEHVRRKYGILGCDTVQAWVRKYGNGSRGAKIRVEKPEEISQLKRLRQRVRHLESALADSSEEQLILRTCQTRVPVSRDGGARASAASEGCASQKILRTSLFSCLF